MPVLIDCDLKPCPFCGAPAEFLEYIEDYPTDSNIQRYQVCCTEHEYHVLDMIATKQELLEVWNQRPNQEPPK